VSLQQSAKKGVDNCVENSINGGILQSLDIITANAEAILDEVAGLKAFISDKQREEGTKPNKCSIKSFYEGIDKINKRRKKQGKPPIKPLIID
jgi:hypothetical protein